MSQESILHSHCCENLKSWKQAYTIQSDNSTLSRICGQLKEGEFREINWQAYITKYSNSNSNSNNNSLTVTSEDTTGDDYEW
jgi:hypothetical protein